MKKVEHDLNLLTARVAELERRYAYVLELLTDLRDGLLTREVDA